MPIRLWLGTTLEAGECAKKRIAPATSEDFILHLQMSKEIQQRPRKTVTDADLEQCLPTSVQKSYFMLSDAERDVLNSALEKYRPGQTEPILVGGAKVIEPALRLMTWYRLEIEETKDGQAITSYTRWVDAVEVKGSKNQEVYLTFSPRFERVWLESKKCFLEAAAQKTDAFGPRSRYAMRLYTWAKNHLYVGTKRITLQRLLFAAVVIGLIYFSSNPHPWTYFDYTFRSACALVSGSLSIDEPPTSWMTEMIPFESHYYSAFPFGSVLTLVPVAFLQKIHFIKEFPTMVVVGIIAGCIALLLLLFAWQYDVSWSKRGILTASILFGTCMWCNLAFGGTWQLNLGFAVLGQIGALYFTRRSAPFLAGASFALAFGNRTEIILLVPVFFYLLGDIKKCAKFSIAPVVLGLATLLYNDLRFHSPLDFGYARIPGVLKEPWYAHGIFSLYAVPDNIKAMLLDPSWKVLNQYPYLVPHGFGGSIFVSSPFLFLIFKLGARDRKMKIVAWVAITLLIIPLWLHGLPGGWQFSYRYVMILLPWIFVLLLESTSARVTGVECALCATSILTNAWASYLFLWTNYVQP